jgi:hypothetical protein
MSTATTGIRLRAPGTTAGLVDVATNGWEAR